MKQRSLVATAAIVAVLIASVAFPAPALAQQAAAYNNPLDQQSDVANWYYYDYFNWWGVDDTPINGHDGGSSWNFNDGSSIDSQYYNYGYFDTDPIDVNGLDNPILSFWCLADFPDINSNYVDRWLYMFDPNYNYFYYFSMGPDGYGYNLSCSSDWHQHQIPIPADIVSAGSLILEPGVYYENYTGESDLQGFFFDELQILVPDVTPPDDISDLAASNPTLTEIQVDWSAPADDDVSGVTASYDLRYSTTPINGTNFDAATQVTGEPNPDVAGTPHSVLVSSLTEDTTYFFAIRTTDLAGNTSGISNVASMTTLAPPPPPPPPAPPPPAGPEEPPDDILPCSAGTSAAPVGLLALAGLVILAAFAGAMKK